MKENNVFQKLWQQRSLFIFVIIAFLLWFINRLSDKYTTYIDIPVKIVSDIEDGKWIENPSFSIVANCMAEGKTIMSYRNGVVSAMEIPVTSLALKNIGEYRYAIDNQSLTHAIQLNAKELTINYIEDSTRVIIISKTDSKMIPVKANVNVTYARQYMNTMGKIVYDIDSIEVQAPSTILDTLTYIETEHKNYERLSHSVSSSVKLKLPENVYSKIDRIPFKIDVERYTQFKITTQVQPSSPSIFGFRAGGKGFHWSNYRGKLTIIPQQVTIFVNLPLSSNIKSNEINAFIDFDKWKDTPKYEVQIAGLPKGSEIVAIEPRIVEAYKVE